MPELRLDFWPEIFDVPTNGEYDMPISVMALTIPRMPKNAVTIMRAGQNVDRLLAPASPPTPRAGSERLRYRGDTAALAATGRPAAFANGNVAECCSGNSEAPTRSPCYASSTASPARQGRLSGIIITLSDWHAR